jgi:APA family basic amino acid/polyamine antiporter
MADPEKAPGPSLVRSVGTWGATLVTVGSVLGTGIFITPGDIARSLPHAGLTLLLWVGGGLVTLAGALTYAELGALFPRAGGQYVFLKETYGRFWGFLFGWGAFLVIMSGGIATLAAGFGEYLGAFVPFFSTGNALFSFSLGSVSWTINGGQLAGALSIVFLTAVNYFGLREGAGLQNAVTVVKIGSLLAMAAFGFAAPARHSPDLLAPLPGGLVPLSAFGVAMIAVFWSFDGWYGVTNLAGEMRRPERDLPRGLIAGTLIVTVLYALMNTVFVRALTFEEMQATGRVGETAALTLFGPLGGRLLTAAVLVSTFGCISATILYAARIYLPMAEDGVFFPAFARIHPRFRTPSTSILAQGVWASLLTFSGTYEQLYTYVIFAVTLFHAATGLAVFVLRRRLSDAPRPYRTWGYPVVPAVFILSALLVVANTLVEKPRESLVGLVLLAIGVPVYRFWRSRTAEAHHRAP